MIRLAALYFATVFAAGFLLGILRIMLLVPRIGARYAELLEIPVMLVVVFMAGRWIAKQTATRRQAFAVGFLALAMLIGGEIALAAIFFGKTPAESLFNKDPISGSAYYLSLLFFAIVPGWVNRRA